MGKAISNSGARQKILILNGSIDRETGPASQPFTAIDFIEAIVRAGEESRGRQHHHLTPLSEDTRVDNSMDRQPAISFPYTSYVTHILHLEGPGTPRVDRERLMGWGIECVRLYGRKVENESGVVVGMRYDPTALTQALEVVLGKKGDAIVRGGLGAARSRRNTLEPLGGAGNMEAKGSNVAL